MSGTGVRPRAKVRLHRDTITAHGVRLAALVYEPEAGPRHAGATKAPGHGIPVVLAHGYTACKETMDVMAGYLCATGRLCMSFDFRGHKLGGSDGSMDSAADAVEDVLAVVERVMERSGRNRAGVVGHSMGGAAGLAAATKDNRIAGVALLGTAASAARSFDSAAGEVLMAQRGDYVIGAPASSILLETGRLCRNAVGLIGIPTLFVAGRADIIVRADAVRELAHSYGANAEFVVVEGGHMDLPVRARGFVAGWLDRLSG